MYHYGWDTGDGWLMLIYMLLFWGGLLTLGFFLVRSLLNSTQSNSQQMTSAEQSALQIAHERYAKGEITPEEHLQIVQNIKDAQK